MDFSSSITSTLSACIFLHHREPYGESRALAGLARDRDVAVQVLYDVVRHGQAQARPLAGLFSGEERVEYLLYVFRRYADAGVGDLDHGEMPAARVLLAVRLDREPALLRHRVERVQDEVHEHGHE